MLIMVVACSEHGTDIIPALKEHPQQKIVFTARFAEAQTKTAFQPDETSIWWSPGDAIAIYYGASDKSEFVSKNTSEVAQAEFEGELNAFTGVTETGEFNYFWAVYPYSSAVSCDGQSVVATLSDQQVAKAGSFATNTNVTIAKSPGLALSFYNVCSWFRFSVTKEGVKRVTFRGNNNEDIAGEFRVSMGEDNRPTAPVVIDGKKEITLTPPDKGTFEVGEMYYITLFPQVFPNGFTVTFETDSQTGSRSINAKATYLRSKYNTGREFDKNVTYFSSIIYNIGDIVDSDGKKGVVCWVSDDGYEVLLMSVTEEKNANWYTAETWCRGYYGHPWRMPTIEELTKIYNNYGSINASLEEASYDKLGGEGYWSNTVNPNDAKQYYQELLYSGFIKYIGVGENTNNATRAVVSLFGGQIPLINVSSVSISPINGVTIVEGETTRMVATVYPAYATDKTIIWHTSDQNIASVNKYGEVTGNKTGNVTITAETQDGGFTSSCAVSVEPCRVTGVSIKSFLALEPEGSAQLAATVSPANATYKSVEWRTSNTSVATVDDDGLVTGKTTGVATITAETVDGGFTSSCEVVVVATGSEPVDLGLSVQWASMNIGASYPSDYGSYFAWGMTEPVYEYSWPYYKWGKQLINSPYYELYKYNSDTYYGDTDGKMTLDLADDVAYVTLGEGWRMPTLNMCKELLANCDWTFTQINGINGFVVKSETNDNSIFLPAGGWIDGQNIKHVGCDGYYWTSQKGSNLQLSVICYGFEDGGFQDCEIFWSKTDRQFGLMVRGVYSNQ